MSIVGLGKLWSCPKTLTLPPDSLMAVFGGRVTVGAVGLANGAVGGDSDRHAENVLGNSKHNARDEAGTCSAYIYSYRLKLCTHGQIWADGKRLAVCLHSTDAWPYWFRSEGCCRTSRRVHR